MPKWDAAADRSRSKRSPEQTNSTEASYGMPRTPLWTLTPGPTTARAQATLPSGARPTTPAVDRFGNTRAPATNPDGTAHNGVLRYASVFGPLMNTPARPDCSDAIVQGPAWDPFRTQKDPTGYVDT